MSARCAIVFVSRTTRQIEDGTRQRFPRSSARLFRRTPRTPSFIWTLCAAVIRPTAARGVSACANRAGTAGQGEMVQWREGIWVRRVDRRVRRSLPAYQRRRGGGAYRARIGNDLDGEGGAR